MRIAITGVNGTIGRPLSQALMKAGHEVYGYDLTHIPAEKMTHYQRCDVRHIDLLHLILFERHPDIIIHLAAEFGRFNGEDYYEDLWSTNVIGTRNILELMASHAPDTHLIFASSSEVYGEYINQLTPYLFESDTTTNHIEISNDYAMSKVVNEQQIRNFTKKHGLKITTLRFFNAYGPGEYFHPYRSVVCLFSHQLLHRRPIKIYRNYRRVFMYIDDLINTLVAVVNQPAPGQVVNIGGTEVASVEEVAEVVRWELGIKDKEFEKLVVYADEDEHNRVHKVPDITKAQQLWQHYPKTTLKTGVYETLKWMGKVYGK